MDWKVVNQLPWRHRLYVYVRWTIEFWLPWELKYLLTPWRWFGEMGLVDFYTRTDEEEHEWFIRSGLAGLVIRHLGGPLRTPRPVRHYNLRLGRRSWHWEAPTEQK